MISKNLVFVVGIISALLLTMTIQLHTVKAAPITLDLKKQKIQALDLLMKK